MKIANITLSNESPFTLMGGMNVIESRDSLLKTAEVFKKVTDELNIPYVFKVSFDKANRSSVHSYRGLGFDESLKILQEVRESFNVPVLTDVHEPGQVKPVSEVVDALQLPAFLSRQTDLVVAMAKSGLPLHIKKAQFLAPGQMKHIIQKCKESGNDKIILCERGTSFGYGHLIVDMLGICEMKSFGYPVSFDVTHSLQLPGGLKNSTGGRREYCLPLAQSAMALGLSALFLEAHPSPDEALCDGPSALDLKDLRSLLIQVKRLDQVVKERGDYVL